MRKVLALLIFGISLAVSACDALPFMSDVQSNTEGAPAGSLTGRVLGPDGKPAASVIVKLYPASKRPSEFRTTSIETEVVSDASGRFSFSHVPEGALNVEAAKGGDLKVFKAEVAVTNAKGTNVGDLSLQPTGAISGKVSAPYAPTVKNFEGVDVYIPGSSYMAKADAEGNFSITNVAVGRFSLVAAKSGLGRASISGIEVKSRSTTSVPVLELSVAQPKILSVSPDNVGPGAEVTITGDNFGASTGETLQVTFNGTIAVSVNRIDDQTIKLIVPSGATSGNAVVTVNGLNSNGMAFTVLKALYFSLSDTELLLGRSLEYVATAMDTAGQTVETPSVTWRVIAGNSIRIDNGKITTLSPGDSTIQVASGTLTLTGRIHVFNVNSVSLNTTAITLNAMPEAGEPDLAYQTSDVLVATVLASDGTNRRVAWSSSDPSRVTVDNGVIRTTRGAEEGEVTITATSVDDPTQSATASVTVTINSDLNLGVN